MSALYLLAGINHFINPAFYLKIMPPYLPEPYLLIILSGAAEIILALLLLYQKTRKVAAVLIILMLLAFMPVHVQMIIDRTPNLSFAIGRFALQFVLIYWAYFFSRKKSIIPERKRA
ncbi:MAG: hypothetical protein H0W61_00305 [Bacteroidetes bacterium]|nr:hypothetical protein [Bacteroidota bacterium]